MFLLQLFSPQLTFFEEKILVGLWGFFFFFPSHLLMENKRSEQTFHIFLSLVLKWILKNALEFRWWKKKKKTLKFLGPKKEKSRPWPWYLKNQIGPLVLKLHQPQAQRGCQTYPISIAMVLTHLVDVGNTYTNLSKTCIRT